MFGFKTPREEGFFEHFKAISERICDAALEFQNLLTKAPDDRAESCMRIKNLEHQADEITHRTMNLLHQTFITPLDREDIHELIKRLDDVIDYLDASAQRIALYKIGPVEPEMIKMAEINVASANLVRDAVARLSDLKNSEKLLEICVGINRLENEADTTLRAAVARLFSDEADIRRLIKLKEIYELLETVTDRCEDVANVIESIIIEYS